MRSSIKANWTSKLFGVCLGVGLLVFGVHASFAGDAADFIGLSAEGVDLCEYNAKNQSLSLEIQADCLRVDHERHGFFRIGLLPVLVAEHARITIASADCLTQVMPAIETWRPANSIARRIELRRLELSLLGKKFPHLTAAVARPEANGTLDLTDVSAYDKTGKILQLKQATLWISGPKTGMLTWNAAGPYQASDFFSPLKNPKLEPHPEHE